MLSGVDGKPTVPDFTHRGQQWAILTRQLIGCGAWLWEGIVSSSLYV
jgi:hypothetical protein